MQIINLSEKFLNLIELLQTAAAAARRVECHLILSLRVRAEVRVQWHST